MDQRGVSMFSAPELSIGFIKRRPASAARVLASLPPVDAAGFLAAIPTRFSATALGRMSPWPAAQIVRHLDAVAAAAVLRELPYVEAAKILRLAPAADRPALLAELPQRLQRSFELSLSFAADSVGANMTTEVATLMVSDSLAQALELVRRSPHDTTELLFITDAQHHYHGVLRALNLLRHPEYFSLADLVDTNCPTLPAQARLDRIAYLDAWNDFGQLPVVSRSGELIGALPRRALRGQASSAQPVDGTPSLAASLIGALAESVTGLAKLVADDTPTDSGDANGR